MDEVLDFDVDGEYGGGNNNNGGGSASKKTGKGTLADLRLEVVMAPVLYAARLYPDQLNPLIESKFKVKGDVDLATVGLSSYAERGKVEEGEVGRAGPWKVFALDPIRSLSVRLASLSHSERGRSDAAYLSSLAARGGIVPYHWSY